MRTTIKSLISLVFISCCCFTQYAYSQYSTFLVSTGKKFETNHTYRFSVFGSEARCREYQKSNPVVNCYQSATFRNDGSAFVLLTDMPNVGTYSIDGDNITVDSV